MWGSLCPDGLFDSHWHNLMITRLHWRTRHGFKLLGTLLCLSCASENPTAATPLKCPPITGEFPPDGCARLAGRVETALVSSFSNHIVAVDTTVRETNSWYVGSTSPLNASGRFSLLVVQVRPGGTAPVPELDSIQLEMKLYTTAGALQRREPPVASQLVWMFFGRWGGEVRQSEVLLRLPTP